MPTISHKFRQFNFQNNWHFDINIFWHKKMLKYVEKKAVEKYRPPLWWGDLVWHLPFWKMVNYPSGQVKEILKARFSKFDLISLIFHFWRLKTTPGILIVGILKNFVISAVNLRWVAKPPNHLKFPAQKFRSTYLNEHIFLERKIGKTLAKISWNTLMPCFWSNF